MTKKTTMKIRESHKKETYKATTDNTWKVKEEQLLYTEDNLLPHTLPMLKDLKPAHNLLAIFDECHNYIYANEGLLKDNVFREIVKLLTMKLYDEQDSTNGPLNFSITSDEYRNLLSNRKNNFESRIRDLFNTVKNKYQSVFFDDSLKLKPLTLAYIVGHLQYVSLSQTPGDVKGEAFQKFVYRHQRGDRGEFFTPFPVVKLAVEMINPKPDEKIIDPACGSGGFLIQTIYYVCKNNPTVDKRHYIQNNIVGIEFNPEVALSAMIRLVFEGGTGKEIVCSNSLLENKTLNNTFDIVLTNPPFGSKGKVKEQGILKPYQLARKWEMLTNGNWELTKNVLSGQSPEILFIEKCLNLLRPGGKMAIVLPDGLLQNISNSHIRFWIRAHSKVLGVVSLPQDSFVPYGTGIKTSLLIIQKLPSDVQTLFMAQIQRIGYDVKGRQLYKKTSAGEIELGKDGKPILDSDIEKIILEYHKFANEGTEVSKERVFTLPETSLNNRLDVEYYKPEDRNLIKRLQAKGAKPICELVDILKVTDSFRSVSDSKIRYIAISDVDASTMQVVSYQTLYPYNAPSRATYRVRTGDIITAISGASTGTQRHATALITEEEDGAICSNGFAVLRNIHGIESFFLLSYMRTEYFLRQVRRLMTGHAIPAISVEDLAKVLVLIPSEEIQNEIANEMRQIISMRKKLLKVGRKIIEDLELLLNKRI